MLYPDLKNSTNNETLPNVSSRYRSDRASMWEAYLKHEESKHRSLLKRYRAISTALRCGEVVLVVAETSLAVVAVASAPLIPVAGVFVGASLMVKYAETRVAKKIVRHTKAQVLAGQKRLAIIQHFAKALDDGNVSESEFEIIKREIEMYDNFVHNNNDDDNGVGDDDDLAKQLDKLLQNMRANNKKNKN